VPAYLVILAVSFGLACGGGAPVDADSGLADAAPTTPDASGVDAGRDPDAASDAALAPPCPDGAQGAGDTVVDLDLAGTTRQYRLHVPDGADGTMPLPLVLNFHGYTSNAGQQIALTRMIDEADARGFVVAHPEGTGLLRSWNAGPLCCGTAVSTDVDDVGFVRAMIDDIASRTCIDPRRVYSTGMSNGGFLSYRLACEAADVVAAIAPVAGVLGIPPGDCTPSRPVPIMHFHGTTDPLVPYDGGTLNPTPSVAETIDGWASRNGCTDAPEITYDVGDTTCETRDECAGGAVVTVCTSEGEGHIWPGGAGFAGGDADIDATSEMWAFFSRFSL
jgi:polyhydroxybutyrate depolymerase